MPLQRVLEPEVMDTVEEAVDYNAMDHSEVNTLFVQDLIACASNHNISLGNVLDLGTGTALIPIELCQASAGAKVLAIDMAKEMLKIARTNVETSQLQERISLQLHDAKKLPFKDGQFECLMSNSIVHHIPEPETCISESARVLANGGLVFVRDLMRPDNDEEVRALVQTYTGQEKESSQKMFDESLRAALSLEEIRGLVAKYGFEPETVQAASDRHWTWSAVKS